MAYWTQLFKFIVVWLKINELELFSELDYWTKLMQLLWVCPAERQNIHRDHQLLPSELNPYLSFFSQQQAFTDTDREIAQVVALTIASRIVSFKVGFTKPPSLTSYLCTQVWNQSQHKAYWPQCLVWNQKKLALCSTVKVFDLQTFSCVQLTNFWVSLIMFDYQTQSKSIEPLSLLEFDYQTSDWLHQAFCRVCKFYWWVESLWLLLLKFWSHFGIFGVKYHNEKSHFQTFQHVVLACIHYREGYTK